MLTHANGPHAKGPYTKSFVRMHDHPGIAHSIEVKDFDEQGMTFHHRSPLHGRRAMVVLESPQLGRFAAEVDLTWCQFNQTGRYTSGGRFVQLVGNTA